MDIEGKNSNTELKDTHTIPKETSPKRPRLDLSDIQSQDFEISGVKITNKNLAQKAMDICVKVAEIKLSAFCAEHNLAFDVCDHLSDLLKETFQDSAVVKKINLKRTKATLIVKNVIGEQEKEELTKILQKQKFSILTDESPDISAVKTSCVLVRFFSYKEGRIVTKVWDLIQVLIPGEATSATAQHLYDNILASFSVKNIPKENVIGFGSDGCSTMMGRNNSVASRLIADFPNISIIKCICHSVAIVASEACKKLPRTPEHLASGIYSFLSRSSKRQCEFIECQMQSETEILKMLHPSQTRWLSLAVVMGVA
ncbi:uncharacterized protein LOC122850462 [Aphidius gifuensis]|uniref:uncharacterized protein LOC122850462 n=1 Tax=Aphidius gifuensis TaxID=684658 RepID=UPI001CDBB8A5|nr:uncharacterized protein LOC122850462 [Aphidius gifuensis]